MAALRHIASYGKRGLICDLPIYPRRLFKRIAGCDPKASSPHEREGAGIEIRSARATGLAIFRDPDFPLHSSKEHHHGRTRSLCVADTSSPFQHR